MRNPATRVLILGIVMGVSACLLSPAPAASAGAPSFTLYVNAADGWGSTNTSLANPGPPFEVYQGDNVTLVLAGTDGQNHNWFIDYDNDSRDDANEPNSPTFQDAGTTWNFTADRNGTFLYRDRFNTGNAGQITVRTGSPPLGGVDTGVAIAIGAIIAFVAVVALLYVLTQKKAEQKPERK